MQITLTHDGQVDIATGKDRKAQKWKNRTVFWSELLTKISQTHRTAETYTDYLRAKKERQDEIKDIGGFVGGYLANGRRLKKAVNHRQLLTLDIDFGQIGFWEDFTDIYGDAAAIYSTHKHSPEKPRLRLVMPIDRQVVPDEYVAIARRVASTLGIEYFDDTTYQPERLMYWPSTSKDGEFVFEYQDGPWLCADDILATYHNWRDSSEWPVSEREGDIVRRTIDKQGDPLEKPGIVGAFCRVYNIHEAIETFLSDIYTACDVPHRYSYVHGSTSSGLITYDDKFSYSHHGTDPTSMKLCNAFDLVRIHKFGLRDDDIDPDTPVNRIPSHVAMEEFARKDEAVKQEVLISRLEQTRDDFAGIPTDDEDEATEDKEIPLTDDWVKDVALDVDKKGNILSTVDNIVLILENDPYFKGRMALDLLENREIAIKKLPWREDHVNDRCLTDKDDAAIRHYLEKRFNISNKAKTSDAMLIALSRAAFHPVRDYLQGLKWDGTPRLDTLFIDYLGAEDTPYTRAVTRKSLVAAVARIYKPGCKFDYVLTLLGPQGVGKSSILNKLGGQWFSDSFGSMQHKEAFEQVQGVWLIEMAELSALRKAEIETVKHFVSKRVDRMRVAYGKRIESFPRQCVFFGTTNREEFLVDDTGNRRWWVVKTHIFHPSKSVFDDMTQNEVDQIWAEAQHYFRKHEPLFLPKNLENEAKVVQARHTESDPRLGLIRSYLDKMLPERWEHMNIYERRQWLSGEDELQAGGAVRRDKVCAAEICCEVLHLNIKDLNNHVTKPIHQLMRHIPGWEMRNGLSFDTYGRQRGYVRVSAGIEKVNELTHEINRN